MPQLFDTALSRHARLRWRNEINSVDRLVMILGRPREQVKDFVDLYLNSYQEKEKLWKLVGLEGAMREESDSKIVEAVLRYVLRSNAVFVINLLNDWLFFADKIKGDPYDFRINTPGTISEKNWSLTVPVSLEDLLALKANKQIRSMIKDSSR
jgi:4-alpha-glucanotransferase